MDNFARNGQLASKKIFYYESLDLKKLVSIVDFL